MSANLFFIFTVVFGLILLIGLVYLGALIKRLTNQPVKTDDTLVEWLKSMQISLDQAQTNLTKNVVSSNKNLTDSLTHQTAQINQRLDKAAEVIQAVNREIGHMSEIGRSMQELQEFLRSPKLRGNFGEQVLKELVSQMLPSQAYKFQYRFRSGETVDAVIKTEKGLIPIDSKFPLENFNASLKAKTQAAETKANRRFAADVRKHVKDISQKYIKPDEGTLDHAVMYIPSEAVYYHVLTQHPELCDQAYRDYKVIFVSPSTFYSFLRSVLISLEGQKIEKEANRVMRELHTIRSETGKLGDSLTTLNRHLTNAYSNMTTIMTNFARLDDRISSVAKLDTPEDKKLTSQ